VAVAPLLRPDAPQLEVLAGAHAPLARSSRIAFAALLVAMSACISGMFLMNELHVLGRPGFPLDDAYIHLQFARNLASGHGLAFNAGEPTPGATSPLWVVVLALGMVFHVPGEWVAIGLGVLAAALSSALVFEVALGAGLAWPLAFLAGVVTAASGRFQWAALSGMETCLAALLSLLLLRQLQRTTASPRSALLTGALAGLCINARPEMALLATAAFVVVARDVWSRTPRERLLVLGAYAAGVVALALPHVVFCLATTGRPLPNTFYAKSVRSVLGGAHELAVLRRHYLAGVMDWAWRDNPAIAILLPLGVAAWLWARHRGGSAVAAWWPVLFWLYAIALYPRHFSLSRYTIPLVPFQALLAVGLLDTLTRRLRPAAWRTAAWAVAAVLVVAPGARVLPAARDIYILHVENILGMQVKMAEWVSAHLPATARVATNDVGAITYFAQRYCIDTEGLVAPRLLALEQASRHEVPRPDGQAVVARYLAEAHPDYCILFPSWYPALVRQPWLERVYSIDRQNLTGGDSHFVVYRVVDPRRSTRPQ